MSVFRYQFSCRFLGHLHGLPKKVFINNLPQVTLNDVVVYCDICPLSSKTNWLPNLFAVHCCMPVAIRFHLGRGRGPSKNGYTTILQLTTPHLTQSAFPFLGVIFDCPPSTQTGFPFSTVILLLSLLPASFPFRLVTELTIQKYRLNEIQVM